MANGLNEAWLTRIRLHLAAKPCYLHINRAFTGIGRAKRFANILSAQDFARAARQGLQQGSFPTRQANNAIRAAQFGAFNIKPAIANLHRRQALWRGGRWRGAAQDSADA